MKLSNIINFFNPSIFQPILTVILIGFLLVLGFQLIQNRNKSSSTNESQIRELTQKISFEDAVNNYYNGKFNVLTNGSLFVRADNSALNLTNLSSSLSPTPSVTEISLVENKYDNLFFVVDKGELKRIDAKSYGLNSSLFFNRKGEIVFLDHSTKKFTLYKVPDDSENDAVTLFESTKLAFEEKLFPLSALLNDYKEQKFNPVERAFNVYSGKWINPIYTDNRMVDVVLQTDPLTGVFSAMFITSSNPPSTIYFDFRKVDSLENYDQIPEDYENIELPIKYKTKE